jgi:hypothetical protein
MPEALWRSRHPTAVTRRAQGDRKPERNTSRAAPSPTATLSPEPAEAQEPTSAGETVLAPVDLAAQASAQLGDGLADKPGLAASAFAPGASRPIIRGLSGFRVGITENGLASGDVSALSDDHAVPIDANAARRVEVVRGPALWLGGVVNASNNRIPEALPANGVTAEVQGGLSSGDGGRNGGAILEAAAGNVVVHADAFRRSAEDYRSPDGKQANTGLEGEGYALGGAYIFKGLLQCRRRDIFCRSAPASASSMIFHSVSFPAWSASTSSGRLTPPNSFIGVRTTPLKPLNWAHPASWSRQQTPSSSASSAPRATSASTFRLTIRTSGTSFSNASPTPNAMAILPCAPGSSGALDQIFYAQRDATFMGAELRAAQDLGRIWQGSWGIDGQYDFVRATLADGSFVPKLPPHRLGGGLYYRDASWSARLSLLHAFAQLEFAAFDTATPAYNLLNAELSYTFTTMPQGGVVPQMTLSLRGENLRNDDIRYSTSFKKDEVLQPGTNPRLFGRIRLN